MMLVQVSFNNGGAVQYDSGARAGSGARDGGGVPATTGSSTEDVQCAGPASQPTHRFHLCSHCPHVSRFHFWNCKFSTYH